MYGSTRIILYCMLEFQAEVCVWFLSESVNSLPHPIIPRGKGKTICMSFLLYFENPIYLCHFSTNPPGTKSGKVVRLYVGLHLYEMLVLTSYINN